MKLHFFILLCMASKCSAQQDVIAKKDVVTVRYYSQGCGQYLTYNREYLSDSVYVEKHGDVVDTFALTGAQLYEVQGQIKYEVIDADADFDQKDGKVKYYFYGLSPLDTLKSENESEVQYELRLSQRIVIYVPAKTLNINGSVTYSYYILGNCYPLTDGCIKSKIANGQYGIVYFDKNIGFIGHSAANAKCKYLITDESYDALTQRRK